MKANHALAALVVLQGVLLAAAWSDRSGPASAAAQTLPNPAEQRFQQIDELRQINEKLDRIATLLEQGRLQVTSKSPDSK
jgi:hypothetical protein